MYQISTNARRGIGYIFKLIISTLFLKQWHFQNIKIDLFLMNHLNMALKTTMFYLQQIVDSTKAFIHVYYMSPLLINLTYNSMSKG